MKYLFICCIILISSYLYGQTSPTELDKSPMDMSYFPINYPIQRIQGKVGSTPVARVTYSRPQKKGRTIFGGEVVKYNEVWRLGANESTEIEFYQNVKIGGKKISKGRYTLYCIPSEKQWTIILNKDLNAWGAFNYDVKKDVLRTDISIQAQTDVVEVFTMYFDAIPNGANLIMLWDNIKVVLPINV